MSKITQQEQIDTLKIQISYLESVVDKSLKIIKMNTGSIGLLQKRVTQLLNTVSALTDVVEDLM